MATNTGYALCVFVYSQDALVFTEPPSKKLYCLLCSKIFRDPMITRCGVSHMTIDVLYKSNTGESQSSPLIRISKAISNRMFTVEHMKPLNTKGSYS